MLEKQQYIFWIANQFLRLQFNTHLFIKSKFKTAEISIKHIHSVIAKFNLRSCFADLWALCSVVDSNLRVELFWICELSSTQIWKFEKIEKTCFFHQAYLQEWKHLWDSIVFSILEKSTDDQELQFLQQSLASSSLNLHYSCVNSC